eukprot:4551144-Pleurochrysis_carterae.AAC.1
MRCLLRRLPRVRSLLLGVTATYRGYLRGLAGAAMRDAPRRAAAAASGRPGQVRARSYRASHTPRTNAIDTSFFAQK